MRFWALILAAILLTSAVQAKPGVDERIEKPTSEQSWGKILSEITGVGKYRKSVALVVGISDYKHFTDLDGAKDDAKKVAEYLVHEAGFDTVFLLTEEKVSFERLNQLMIKDIPESLDKGDRFVFYWSGHGVSENLRNNSGTFGHLVLPHSEPRSYFQMIGMNILRDWDVRIPASQVLYIVDACFSGLAWATPKNDRRRPEKIEEMARDARHFFTAGVADEETLVVPALGGSIFTAAILEGLRGAADAKSAFPRDGIVSVSELEAYVRERVRNIRLDVRWPKTITPKKRDIGLNSGEFFFISSEHKKQIVLNSGYAPTGFAYGKVTSKSQTSSKKITSAVEADEKSTNSDESLTSHRKNLKSSFEGLTDDELAVLDIARVDTSLSEYVDAIILNSHSYLPGQTMVIKINAHSSKVKASARFGNDIQGFSRVSAEYSPRDGGIVVRYIIPRTTKPGEHRASIYVQEVGTSKEEKHEILYRIR